MDKLYVWKTCCTQLMMRLASLEKIYYKYLYLQSLSHKLLYWFEWVFYQFKTSFIARLFPESQTFVVCC
jgi:hypothetical protein